MAQVWPSFSFFTDDLTVDSVILLTYSSWRLSDCKLPVSAVKAQIINPPPPCLTVAMRCLCRCAVYDVIQSWCCAVQPDIVSLLSSVQRTMFHKSCDFFNLIRGSLFASLSNNLSSLFLIVLWWTLTFVMIIEACRVWDLALGFVFAVSLSITGSDFGVNLPGRPFSVKLWHYVNTQLFQTNKLPKCQLS